MPRDRKQRREVGFSRLECVHCFAVGLHDLHTTWDDLLDFLDDFGTCFGLRACILRHGLQASVCDAAPERPIRECSLDSYTHAIDGEEDLTPWSYVYVGASDASTSTVSSIIGTRTDTETEHEAFAECEPIADECQ